MLSGKDVRLGESSIKISSREVNCPKHAGNVSRPLHCLNFSFLRAVRFFMLSGKYVRLGQSKIKISSKEECPNHPGNVSRPLHSVNLSILSRGGNGSDADRIVLLPLPFSYFQNEYESEYGCSRIQIRLGYYSNTDTYRIFS